MSDNNRRQEILNASLDLFIRKGYEGTTTKEIAKAVGISQSLLFHYFSTKEAILMEWVKMGFYGPTSVYQIDSTNPLAFFEETAKGIMEYLEKEPVIAKIFLLMSYVYKNPHLLPEAYGEQIKNSDNISPSIPIIEEGQKAGVIKDGIPISLAVAFWGAIQGVAEVKALYPDMPLPDYQCFVDILAK